MLEVKEDNGFFKPGRYEAQLDGIAKIKTEVLVDKDKILDVKLRSLKGERKISPDIEKIYRGQILKAQSVNIDGVTSASILTKAVKSVVGDALADARVF